MTTSRVPPDHYTSDPILNEYNHRWRSYSQNTTNDRGFISHRSNKDQYNIVERDYGDHKVYDFLPIGYRVNYDIPQYDEKPVYEEQNRNNSPIYSRRKYAEPYDNINHEKLPMISPRQHTYVSPRRPYVTKRTYFELAPSQTSNYSYDNGYKPQTDEVIEYIIQERIPRHRYVLETYPVQYNAPSEILPSVPRSTHHSPNRPDVVHHSPNRSDVAHHSPSRISLQQPTVPPLHFNGLSSSPRSTMKQQQTPHTLRTNRESPNKLLAQKINRRKHISLKDILAENRARRGSSIPKPRREVDEIQLHDQPICNKDFIKEDFFIHK